MLHAPPPLQEAVHPGGPRLPAQDARPALARDPLRVGCAEAGCLDRVG